MKHEEIVNTAVRLSIERKDPRLLLPAVKRMLSVYAEPDEVEERVDYRGQVYYVARKRLPFPHPRDAFGREVLYIEKIVTLGTRRETFYYFDEELQEGIMSELGKYVKLRTDKRLGIPRILSSFVVEFLLTSPNPSWNSLVERFYSSSHNSWVWRKANLPSFPPSYRETIERRNREVLEIMKRNPSQKDVRINGHRVRKGEKVPPSLLYYVIASPERFYAGDVVRRIESIRARAFFEMHSGV